jgi:RimJ/RimL family protein N-acetyltransferase
MTATVPERHTLFGRYLRLEPLRRADLPSLYTVIGQPLTFASGFGGGPGGYRDTEKSFVAWAEGYFAWGAGIVFAVRLNGGPHDGELVGTTTLGHFKTTREHTEIGWTAYDPRVWGTQVNAEAKLLLLALAFESGFGRVQIQADVMNERSRAAIARLGATFEGIVRRDRLREDGSWRDSAVFSVIIDDWPRVRASLEDRLAAYGDRPVLFRTAPPAGSPTLAGGTQ